MDLGTPEPQSESEEGEIEKTGVPRGPRTPPPDDSEKEKQPHTPEGSPPRIPKSHRGPRTPSPARHSSSRRRSHRKRRRRSRSSKVKGPRTPSPVDITSVQSSRSSSKSLLSPSKSSYSPSPHTLGQGSDVSLSTATVTSQKPTASPKLVQEDNAVTGEESVPIVDSVQSQVAKSGSNSPTLKSDTPKLHSPLPVLPHTPPQSNSPPFSSSQEHSPLNLSLDSEVERTETKQKSTSPPKKKHRGEGRGKAKSKTSKAKEEYRHKVSQIKHTL